ncbi:hypothetical protein ZTR_00584 [Talaromyces verruculosus]|nr:hypothetical protein ZTR_00584 [Talaromyces verruculosus]
MAPSIATIDASAPIDMIIKIIEKDGGVIISNFLSPDLLKETNDATEPHFKGRKIYDSKATHDELGSDFFPKILSVSLHVYLEYRNQ